MMNAQACIRDFRDFNGSVTKVSALYLEKCFRTSGSRFRLWQKYVLDKKSEKKTYV